MKKINLILISSILLLSSYDQSFAQVTVDIAPPKGMIPTTVTLASIVNFLVQALFAIGSIAAVCYLIYGGIKWIISGGDKAGVEAARNHIIAAIVGLIIVVGTFAIISLVYDVLGLGTFTSTFTLPKI
ncbi:hypothetical protein LBMAG33_5690 [Candidatus Levyibacteriota bacterium]|nr:hypothetical protein LBMAG33_5690 [Candidatus Levybacteria bacterium]